MVSSVFAKTITIPVLRNSAILGHCNGFCVFLRVPLQFSVFQQNFLRKRLRNVRGALKNCNGFPAFHKFPLQATLTTEKACNGFPVFRRFPLQSPKKDVKAAPKTASRKPKTGRPHRMRPPCYQHSLLFSNVFFSLLSLLFSGVFFSLLSLLPSKPSEHPSCS